MSLLSLFLYLISLAGTPSTIATLSKHRNDKLFYTVISDNVGTSKFEWLLK